MGKGLASWIVLRRWTAAAALVLPAALLGQGISDPPPRDPLDPLPERTGLRTPDPEDVSLIDGPVRTATIPVTIPPPPEVSAPQPAPAAPGALGRLRGAALVAMVILTVTLMGLVLVLFRLRRLDR